MGQTHCRVLQPPTSPPTSHLGWCVLWTGSQTCFLPLFLPHSQSVCGRSPQQAVSWLPWRGHVIMSSAEGDVAFCRDGSYQSEENDHDGWVCPHSIVAHCEASEQSYRRLLCDGGVPPPPFHFLRSWAGPEPPGPTRSSHPGQQLSISLPHLAANTFTTFKLAAVRPDVTPSRCCRLLCVKAAAVNLSGGVGGGSHRSSHLLSHLALALRLSVPYSEGCMSCE